MKKLESMNASAGRKILVWALAAQMAALNAGPAWAGGPLPVPKDATGITTDGTTMQVGEERVNSTIGWQSFDIGQGYTVRFMDEAGHTTVNKVDAGNPSSILGSLLANGNIYLLNPDGILFGATAKVNVGGLVASSMDYDPATRTFSHPGGGDITVEGGASINAGAFAYLVGKSVNVAGTVNSGDTFIGAYGGLTEPEIELATANGGKIVLKLGDNTATDGGSIELTGDLSTGGSEAYAEDGVEIDAADAQRIVLYAARDIHQAAGGTWTASAPEVQLTAAGGNILQEDDTAVTTTGTTTLESGGGGIGLGEGNDFGGTVNVRGGQVWLADANGIELGNVEARELVVEALDGDITQAAGTAVESTWTKLSATGNITLGNEENDFREVQVFKGQSVTLADAKGADPAEMSVPSISGRIGILLESVTASNLAVKALMGSIIQRDVSQVKVTGATTLEAEGDIVLTSALNDFRGTVSVNAENGDASLVNENAIELGDVTTKGGLTVTAKDGDISQAAGTAVEAGGATALSATGDITLGNEGNDFMGAVKASGKDVTLTDMNGILLGAVTATNLTVTAKGGGITQSRAATVRSTTSLSASGDITLGNEGNDFGFLDADGGNVTLTDQNGIVLDTVNADGNLTVTAKGGDIESSDVGGMVVKGTTSLTATGDIKMDAGAKDFHGTVTASGQNVTLRDEDDLTVGDVTAGTATLIAGENVVMDGAITVGSGFTAKAQGLIQETGSGVMRTTGDTDRVELEAGRGIELGNEDNSFIQLIVHGTEDEFAPGTYHAIDGNVNVTVNGDRDWTASAPDITDADIPEKGILAQVGSSVNGNVKLENVGEYGTIVLYKNGLVTNEGEAGKGDVSLSADKAIAVTQGIQAANDVAITSQAGHIFVKQSVKAQGSVNASAGEGNIHIGSSVSTTNGNVNFSTGNGNIHIGADVASGGDTALTTGNGNITVDNSVSARDGNVSLASGEGDISIKDKVIAKSEDGAEDKGNVTVSTEKGNIEIGDNGEGVNTVSADRDITLETGLGRVQIKGGVASTGGDATVSGKAENYTAGTEGMNIQLDGHGKVQAAGDVALQSENGDIHVTGLIMSDNGLTAEVQKQGSVYFDRSVAVSDDVTVTAQKGDIHVDNDVVSAGGDISLRTTEGNVHVVNKVTANQGSVTVATEKGNIQTEGNLVAGQDIAIESGSGNIMLATVTAGSNLTVTAAGGKIGQENGTAVTVGGETWLEASGAIALTNFVNDFQGTVNAKGGAVSLTDVNSIALGEVDANSLTVRAQGGNITQSGPATVVGDTVLEATAGSSLGDITLDNDGNDFHGSVKFLGGNVTLTDTNGIVVEGFATNCLTLTAIGGDIEGLNAGSGVIVLGDAHLTAAGDIMLGIENKFDGAVEASGRKVRLMDTYDGIELGKVTAIGNLTVSAIGNITQSDAVTVGETADLLSSDGDIVLDNEGNDFQGGVQVVHASSVTLTDKNDIELARVNADSLTVEAKGGAITQNDPVTVENATSLTATGDITLDNAANDFGGAVSASGKDVTLTDANDIVLGAVAASNLTVTAKGRSITQDAGTAVTVEDATVLTATEGLIVLTNGGNDFGGAVTATAGGDVSLADANSIQLGNVSAEGGLTVWVSGGNITQATETAVEVGGMTTLKATGDITLGNDGNDFGGRVDATAENQTVTLADTNTLTLGNVTAEKLVVRARPLEQAEGTTLDVKSMKMETTGGPLELGAINLTGALEAEAESITGSEPWTAGSADLRATAGDITMYGVADIAGTTELHATGGDVVAANTGNRFGGAVSASGSNITLRAAGDLALGEIDAEGKLEVVADSISGEERWKADSAELTVDEDLTMQGAADIEGTTILKSSVDITADNAANRFGGAVSADAGLHLTLAGTSLEVGDVSADEPSLKATEGDLTQMEGTAVTAAGAAVLEAAGNVVLTNAANDFRGEVTATAGGDVALRDTDNLELGNVTATNGAVRIGGESIRLDRAVEAGGALRMEADGGDIEQRAGSWVTAGGEAVLTASGGDIKLGNERNDFRGTVEASGRDVALGDQDGIELGAVTAMSNLTVTAGGDITQKGGTGVEAGGVAALSAGGNIVVTNGVNDFGGAVTASAGGDALLRDANDLTLGAVTATNGEVRAVAATNLTVTGAVTGGGEMVGLGSQGGTLRLDAPVEATDGEVYIEARGPVESTTNGTVTASGQVRMFGTEIDLGGDATAGGDLWAVARDGDLAVAEGADLKAGGNATLYVGRSEDEPADGNIRLAGNAEAGGKVWVSTFGTGDVTQADSSTITAGNYTVLHAFHGDIAAESARNSFGTNGVEVFAPEGAASVAGEELMFRYAGVSQLTARATGGDITQTETGSFEVMGAATLEAAGKIVLTNEATDIGGPLTATGSSVEVVDGADETTLDGLLHGLTLASVTATNGDARITSADGTLTVDGAVQAAGNVVLKALDEGFAATADSTVTAGDTLVVAAPGGDIALEGRVQAKDADFAAEGSVTAANGENDFTGMVTASGQNVWVADANDLELGEVSATGWAVAQAGADLDVTGAVKGDQMVYLEATNGTARVDAPVESTGGVVEIAARNVESTTNGTITAATDAFVGVPTTANAALSGKVTAGHNVVVNAGSITLDADAEAGYDLQAVGSGPGDVTITTNANLAAGNFLCVAAGADTGVGPQDGSIFVDGNATAGYMLQFVANGMGDVVQASSSTMASGGLTSLNAFHGNIVAESESNEFGPEGVRAVAPEGTVSLAATNGIMFRAVAATQLSARAVSGDISQLEGQPFDVAGETTLVAPGSIALENAENDFGGAVSATADNGSVRLADANALALGEVSAKEDIEATAGTTLEAGGAVEAGGDLTLVSGGDMEVAGAVAAGNNATATAGGAFTLADTGSLTAAQGGASVVANGGDATIAGTVRGGTTASVGADGAATVGAAGSVEATGEGGTAIVTGSSAMVEAGGKVSSAGGAAMVIASEGDATVAGQVAAGTNASVVAMDGDAEVSGEVNGDEKATVMVMGGNARVSGTVAGGSTSSVSVLGGGATVEGEVRGGDQAAVTTLLGDAMVSGTVEATGAEGVAKVEATGGDAEISGTVQANGDKGTASVTGASTAVDGLVSASQGAAVVSATDGDATIGGQVIGGDTAAVTATNGATTVTGSVKALVDDGLAMAGGLSATVEAGGEVSAEAENGVAYVAAVGGDAQVDGTVKGSLAAAVEANENATVGASGTVEATGDEGIAGVLGRTGDVTIKGTLKSARDALVQAGNVATVAAGGVVGAETGGALLAAGGDAQIDGTVKGATSATVETAGDATVGAQGTVEATGADGFARVVAEGDATVEGTLKSEGDALVQAGNDVAVAAGATVGAGRNLTVDAGNRIEAQSDLTAGHDLALVAGGGIAVGGVALTAGNALVGTAGEDFSLTAATLAGTDIGLEATGNLTDAGATLTASGLLITKADGLMSLTGTASGRETGFVSSGDLTLDNVESDMFAATSTGGSVTVNASKDLELANLSGGKVTATRADGREASVEASGPNGIQAAKDATLSMQGHALRGSQVEAGGNATINNAGSVSLSGVSGRDVAITAGNTDIGTVKASGKATLRTGNLTVKELSADGSADIDARGSIQMGQLTAKKADISAGGSIGDNNSRVKTDNLTMKAGGDVGSSGRPIVLESKTIESVTGKNIYLKEMSSGNTVYLGRIDADGRVELAAPLIGLPHGKEGGFLPLRAGDVNIRAPGGLRLKVDGFFGQPGKAMKVDARGEWTVESETLHGGAAGSSQDYIYMIFTDSTAAAEDGALPMYLDASGGSIPGLIIYNGQPLQGNPDLLRNLRSALAFSADTPELKITQGAFGNPLFLDTEVVRTDMVPTGYVDYLPRTFPGLWGDAFPAVTTNPWLERPALYPLHAPRAAKDAPTKDTDPTAPGAGLDGGVAEAAAEK